MSSGAPPRSVWSRSTRLVKLAAGLASREVSGRVGRAVDRGEALARDVARLRTQVEQAKEIVASLGQLKGAAMKAGQLVSMELSDVLPPEVIEVLAQLQDSGATVPYQEIRSILEEELGADTLAQVDVDEVPVASASIGQVHRARWRTPQGGVEEVALKVQFRGIAESIDSDLTLLERIARVFLAARLQAYALEGVFAELKDVLVRETDYLHEAAALERYRARALEVPGLVVPRVHHPLSSRRVLALSYERGVKLKELIAAGPPRATREWAAHTLLDLYFREFFEWGLVQTDANFANFLFRPERREVVLLDFGATREYPPHFVTLYRTLLTASMDRDRDRAYAAAVELGIIDPRESPAARDALHALLESVLWVFSQEAQPVDFTRTDYVADAAGKLKAYYRALERMTPPAQLIFLHRKLGGVFTIGKVLGVSLDVRQYWERMARACVEPARTG